MALNFNSNIISNALVILMDNGKWHLSNNFYHKLSTSTAVLLHKEFLFSLQILFQACYWGATADVSIDNLVIYEGHCSQKSIKSM